VNESGVKQTFKGFNFPPCRDIRTLLLSSAVWDQNIWTTPVMEALVGNVPLPLLYRKRTRLYRM
jgi:hypothetical protein